MKTLSRYDAMQNLVLCLESAVEACGMVETFNPTLANFALKALAKIALKISSMELRK